MNDNDIVIIEACRTAIGSFNGAIASVSAVELGSIVIKTTYRKK